MSVFTKTFVENRWFRRLSPGHFAEIPKSETEEGPSIDEQVRAWVTETGYELVHPGQIGMHTTFHGNDEEPDFYKCLTLGLTVLYRGASNG